MALNKKTELSQAKFNSIFLARTASRQKLAGRSPRTVGEERAKDALEWTYRWGWTTPTILELVMKSAGRSGLGNRLVKSGLLMKTQTPSGGINDTPSCILTLSKTGLEKATELVQSLHQYELDPSKIKFSTINHGVMIQRLTATRLNTRISDARILKFQTQKELAAKKTLGEKVPDAVWDLEFSDGKERKIAVELELSGKYDHEFDMFVYLSLLSLYGKNGQPAKYKGLEIYSTSAALLARYEAAFEPGQMLQVWAKEAGKTGRWIKEEKLRIPDRNFDDQIQFIKIDNSMLGKKPVARSILFPSISTVFDDSLE